MAQSYFVPSEIAGLLTDDQMGAARAQGLLGIGAGMNQLSPVPLSIFERIGAGLQAGRQAARETAFADARANIEQAQALQKMQQEAMQRASLEQLAQQFEARGDMQRAAMIRAGVAPDKLIESGAPRLESFADGNMTRSFWVYPDGRREPAGVGPRWDPNSAGGGVANMSLTPTYGIAEDGQTIVPMQFSSRGGLTVAPLPPGVSAVLPPTRNVDTGTGTALVGPGGVTVDNVPKDIKGQKSLEAQGTAEGQARAAAPGQMLAANTLLATVNGLIDDPNRERGTGKSSVFNAVPFTAGADFQAKIDQLGGQTFLQAFESLKGGGQITEIEGLKAQNAIARLSTAQTEEGFLQALKDLREVALAAHARARAMLNGGAPDPLGIR